MSKKKKNLNNNNETKNHDVVGIICVIISAFFLICLVTPLLSDIGVFVKNVTTGLLGYVSYPVALCVLLYGILLLMNKKAKLSAKQIAYVILMSICGILFLQTLFDAEKLNGSFGEYFSGIFSISEVGRSVGGLIFGTIAYFVKSVLSFIGAYVLYGLIFVLFMSLLLVDFKKTAASVVRQNNQASQRKEYLPFIKGKSEAQPVRDINDTTLFVGTIERTNKVNSVSGDFASMYTPFGDTISRYDEVQPMARKQPEQPFAQAESSEEEQRRLARERLYGSPDEMRKKYDAFLKDNMNVKERTSGRSNYLIDNDQFISSQGNVATPKIENEHKRILPDVPIPPQKDVSDKLVVGPILNGEEISKTIKDDTQWRSPNEDIIEEHNDVSLPPIITGNPIYKKPESVEHFAPVIQPKSVEPEVDLPPIVNGDAFAAEKEKSVRKQDESVSASNARPQDKFATDDQEESVELEYNFDAKADKIQDEIELPQIIVADDFASSAIEKEQNSNDELDEEFDANEPINEADEINVAPITLGSTNSYRQDSYFDNQVNQPLASNENDVVDVGEFNSENVESSLKTAEKTINYSESEEYFPEEIREKYNLGEYAPSSSYAQSEDISIEESLENVQPEQSLAEENKSFPEAKIPDSLKLIDEEVDMSEVRDEINDDNTGYYVREGFNQNVDQISLKLSEYKMSMKKGGGVNNQINMDDYDVIVPESVKPKKKKKHLRYTPPPIDLLVNSSTPPDENDDCEEKASILEQSLNDLKIGAKVINITKGPAVTRYELEMPLGQSVSKITGRGDDIAYALASDGKIRIEAPIRGKRAVGVEVPNKSIAIVSLREVIESKEFENAKSELTLALGKGITGNIMTCNLEKMPHLLIAGTTGSGKSACLNSIIISILYKASPDDVRLILVDPKQVEFVLYRDMPHLLMKNIIKDSVQACNAFKWAREEMDKRYALFAQHSVRNLSDYNQCEAVKSGLEPKMPRIVIVVDELSELMLAKNSKELEQNIMSLAQKARAAGVHLILATQRPSVDVITGTIKANFPSRIAFAVKSIPDSRTILDQIGAESLLGRGDMLYAPIDSNDPIRVQGAFITTEEIENIVNYVRNNNEADYDEAVENIIMKKPEDEVVATADSDVNGEAAEDPLTKDVLRRIIETKIASASSIQRRFSVGYNRASRILDQLEEKGYVGMADGSKPREVYITSAMFNEIYGEDV